MEKLEKIAVKVGQGADDDDFDPKVEPKVMEPYDPIPGRVPRKVAIDRKKKEYASFNIEQLLIEHQIDFLEKTKEIWLPLEYFDDSTFDDYSNRGWIDKKYDEDGNPRKLTGKGLKIGSNSWTYEPI